MSGIAGTTCKTCGQPFEYHYDDDKLNIKGEYDTTHCLKCRKGGKRK